MVPGKEHTVGGDYPPVRRESVAGRISDGDRRGREDVSASRSQDERKGDEIVVGVYDERGVERVGEGVRMKGRDTGENGEWENFVGEEFENTRDS